MIAWGDFSETFAITSTPDCFSFSPFAIPIISQNVQLSNSDPRLRHLRLQIVGSKDVRVVPLDSVFRVGVGNDHVVCRKLSRICVLLP